MWVEPATNPPFASPHHRAYPNHYMTLLHPSRPDAPHLDRLYPRSAIPGGAFELLGSHLIAGNNTPQLPHASFGETPAHLDLARPTRAIIRVPSGAISSALCLS